MTYIACTNNQNQKKKIIIAECKMQNSFAEFEKKSGWKGVPGKLKVLPICKLLTIILVNFLYFVSFLSLLSFFQISFGCVFVCKRLQMRTISCLHTF